MELCTYITCTDITQHLVTPLMSHWITAGLLQHQARKGSTWGWAGPLYWCTQSPDIWGEIEFSNRHCKETLIQRCKAKRDHSSNFAQIIYIISELLPPFLRTCSPCKPVAGVLSIPTLLGTVKPSSHQSCGRHYSCLSRHTCISNFSIIILIAPC